MPRNGRRQPLPRIFDGSHLTCPRCRTPVHVLDAERLPEMPLFEDQTVPVFRCSSCRFVYAPRSAPVARA